MTRSRYGEPVADPAHVAQIVDRYAPMLQDAYTILGRRLHELVGDVAHAAFAAGLREGYRQGVRARWHP